MPGDLATLGGSMAFRTGRTSSRCRPTISVEFTWNSPVSYLYAQLCVAAVPPMPEAIEPVPACMRIASFAASPTGQVGKAAPRR